MYASSKKFLVKCSVFRSQKLTCGLLRELQHQRPCPEDQHPADNIGQSDARVRIHWAWASSSIPRPSPSRQVSLLVIVGEPDHARLVGEPAHLLGEAVMHDD